VAADVNLWSSPEHALDYLRRADTIPHRVEGEATLLEFVPPRAKRILDLGSGAGRLLGLVKSACPGAKFVAVDFSPTMIQKLREQFGADSAVSIVSHDLTDPMLPLGKFDAVVSSFAIHHLHHKRKRTLYEEIFRLMGRTGCFAIWSMFRRQPPCYTNSSSRNCKLPPKTRTPPTSCSIWKLSWDGCARLALPTSTAIGSGGNWRCLAAVSQRY
jgi:ubiquinone/menaquinone biosynthesis C-methylase UbiE